MNFLSKILCFGLFLSTSATLLSACVTTRAQLNEERGIVETQDQDQVRTRSSVKSEDLGASSNVEETRPSQSVPATAGEQPPGVPVAASGGYTNEELRAEIARLNGRVEELEHEKKMKEEERELEQKKLQDQVTGLEKQLKENEPAPGPKVPEGKSTFEAGKDAYFGGLYEQAVQFMDQYLQKNESASDADQKKIAEAIYIRGESNFKRKEFEHAIIDFSKFPERFQKSSYHPKALLRIAESFEALKHKEDALAFYSSLAEQFPKTAEGKLAKKRMKKK